jgi:hypothetical protein
LPPPRHLGDDIIDMYTERKRKGEHKKKYIPLNICTQRKSPYYSVPFPIEREKVRARGECAVTKLLGKLFANKRISENVCQRDTRTHTEGTSSTK